MKRSRRIAVRVVLIALVVTFVGASVAATVKARSEAHRLLTNPMTTRHLPGQTPLDYGMVFDEVTAHTSDGLALAGWYVPGTNGAIVIAHHGYKADRGEMLNEAAMLSQHGYGVLISSLRAHDMSDGEVITFGRNEMTDLAAWTNIALHEPELSGGKLGMLGNSFGGAMAIQFAAEHPTIRAVVTNSAFSSLEDTVTTSVRYFTGLPPFPFVPLISFWAEHDEGVRMADIDVKRWISRLSPRPVMLMQGGADQVISTTSGQRLYDAAGEPKVLWFEPNVGHAKFDQAMPAEYERRVVGFFDRYLLTR